MFKFTYELFQTSGLSAQRDDFCLQSVYSRETEKEGSDICYWKRGQECAEWWGEIQSVVFPCAVWFS